MTPTDPLPPLDPEVLRVATPGGVRVQHLRYTGHGAARVPAHLYQPLPLAGARPAIILQHGANTSKDDFYIQAPAKRWAQAGFTVLAIDLAEHGERVDGEGLDPMARRRLIGEPEFVAQSVLDLSRGVDLLGATQGVDPERIGFAGFSMGGMLGTVFAAKEPRVRAVAIVIAGSFAHMRYWERGDTEAERARRRAAAEATDPAFFAAAIAPRPFLMVNTEDDPIFPRAAVLALFEAARDPKELHWHPGTHHQWGVGIYKDVWEFLRRHLEAA